MELYGKDIKIIDFVCFDSNFLSLAFKLSRIYDKYFYYILSVDISVIKR